MKYYLVALFDDVSYKNLSPIQRSLSKRFRANRNSPIPYIPLEVIENPNIDKLNSVMDKILKPYKNFNVTLCDSNKTLNLKIENIGYIKKIDRLIADNLKLYGFNIKGGNDELHLSLANINYLNKDNKKFDSVVEYKPSISTLKVNRIELWKISNNRRETLIQTYPLKTI